MFIVEEEGKWWWLLFLRQMLGKIKISGGGFRDGRSPTDPEIASSDRVRAQGI